MPPPRRAARRRAAAAESTFAVRRSRRLSVRHGESFKREGRCGNGGGDNDDGLPLSDEALLLVFSAPSFATADLVRCAATCRRWRRLVSADAAFICPRATPRSDPCIRSLALGFFHHSLADDGGVVARPRFVPLSAAAASRLPPSFAALVDGGASRVVASRNGRLVLDLRRRANSRVTHAVVLGVYSPVTGGGNVDVLPQLRGKDSPTGPYACTVITAADERGGGDRRTSMTRYSSYRVLLLYNRRRFTALRCYSSDAGSWGPEAEVTGARIGRTQLAVGPPHAAVVHRGVVFWPRLAVALRLDSVLQQPAPAVPAAKPKNDGGKAPPPRHTVAGFSLSPRRRHSSATHRLLGVMPGGRLLRVEADSETIRAYWGGREDDGDADADDAGGDDDIADGGGGGASKLGRTVKRALTMMGELLEWRWTMKQALMMVHTVRLRWLCEKSGLVVFTAGNGSDPYTHVYTLDVETRQFSRVATVAGDDGDGESASGEMCGYEMDRVTLLASLGR